MPFKATDAGFYQMIQNKSRYWEAKETLEKAGPCPMVPPRLCLAVISTCHVPLQGGSSSRWVHFPHYSPGCLQWWWLSVEWERIEANWSLESVGIRSVDSWSLLSAALATFPPGHGDWIMLRRRGREKCYRSSPCVSSFLRPALRPVQWSFCSLIYVHSVLKDSLTALEWLALVSDWQCWAKAVGPPSSCCWPAMMMVVLGRCHPGSHNTSAPLSSCL